MLTGFMKKDFVLAAKLRVWLLEFQFKYLVKSVDISQYFYILFFCRFLSH